MSSSVSGAPPPKARRRWQTNNQNNAGLIGDGSNNIVTSGNNNQLNQFNITQVAPPAEGEDIELDKLLGGHVSKDALRNSFYSPPECHPNTRTTIRNEIGGWIDESASKKSPILWLNGPAAVGKSVIAKTVSGFHDEIVATFFFSTSSDKTAVTLFPTLAWQLARRIPDTRKHIIASLKNSDSLQTSQIEEQFDRLIIQPLKSVTALRSRPVMVIDGVDECTDERMLGRFLRVLMEAAGEGDKMPVRFMICSRPESRIRTILEETLYVTPTTAMPKPQLQRQVPRPDESGSVIELVLFLATVGVGAILFIGLYGLFRLVLTLGIHEFLQETRRHGIFHLFRSGVANVILETKETWYPVFASFGMSIASAIVLGLLLSLFLDRPAHLPKQSRSFVQDVWELYRSRRLDIDEDISSTPDRLTGALDTIRYHPVISTIQIVFSEECKDDIARYLSDKFNTIYRPGEGASSWFQPSDIADLVEASCGQFLYASTIVRLLDESYLDPSDVLKTARSSFLPTPDLDELYKVILKRAQEGSPDHRTGWHFVMDSLSILVFLAGNVHFLKLKKNFPVIEFLLGLGKGELNKKLRKMHSVLNIVPGESVNVYHRSFLEFLQNRSRSEKYHISYSIALRRVVVFMIRAGLSYKTLLFEDERLEAFVYGIVTESPRNFFGRSRFPKTLSGLHAVVHVLISSSWLYILRFYFPEHVSIRITPLKPILVLQFYLLLGEFIFSLATYIFFLKFSIIVPFLHPFVHPLFIVTNGLLWSLPVLSVVLFFVASTSAIFFFFPDP